MNRKKPRFKDYFNKSKEYYENSNFKEVLNNLKKAVPYENSHEYWMLICEVNLSSNKFNEADDAINNAIHINNNSARAWYLKSRTSLGLMNYKKALRASERALSIKDKSEYRELNQNIRNFLNMDLKDYNDTAHVQNQLFTMDYANRYDNMVIFVNSENFQLLENKKFTNDIYYPILESVIDEGILNKDISGDIFTKIIKFSECFVNIGYKQEGEAHGTYICNTVKIDNRLNTSRKIGAFIHELAHHFLSEIFEQAIMYVFDSVKTDTIEAFAWYAISQKPEWLLMNEYCAHTVECYFMPYDGKNYESFNKVLKENFNPNDSTDLEMIERATVIGNTFAQDIIRMLNMFLTDDLKDEIKIQYVKDRLYSTRYFGTEYLTNRKFVDEYKFDLINKILKKALWDIKINFSYAQLYYFKESFKKANRKR